MVSGGDGYVSHMSDAPECIESPSVGAGSLLVAARQAAANPAVGKVSIVRRRPIR